MPDSMLSCGNTDSSDNLSLGKGTRSNQQVESLKCNYCHTEGSVMAISTDMLLLVFTAVFRA
jgi:hypothetical protein